MASVSPAPRLYRGISPTERRAQRREQLLQAGLELFGTQGYANTSIRAVSEAASLNSRYFYESFASREDLLYHVYSRTVEEIFSDVAAATAEQQTIEEQAQAGVRSAWTNLVEDPRRARVIALEVVGVSDRLQRSRRANMHAFADLVVENTQRIGHGVVRPRMNPVLTARSLVGAIVDTLEDWINGDVDASVEEVVDHFTQLFAALYTPETPA